ncbi:MAG TPA: RICIN domain-containing protein, partial [Chryseosolibacter sp.]
GTRLTPFVPTYPSAPAAITVTSKTSTEVSLRWKAATDDGGVTGYEIFKDNLLVGSTVDTVYTATGLTAGITYNFRIQAKDADGNSSPPGIIKVTTVPAFEPDPFIESENLLPVGSQYPAVFANTQASGGKVVGNNFSSTSISISNWYGFDNGAYVLSIRYASDVTKTKSLLINDVLYKRIVLPATSGFGTFQIQVPLKQSELNKITLLTNFGDDQGGDYDFFRLDKEANVIPSAAVANDSENTLSWTDAISFPGITNYEYSVDRGQSWKPVETKPQHVGNGTYTYGMVRVRVKGDPSANRTPGLPLLAPAFTYQEDVKPQLPGQVLWQLGKDDVSSAEFRDYVPLSPERVDVPDDWNTRANWNIVSKGLRGDQNDTLEISYQLTEVPEFGVELNFRILDGTQSIPQMAVFSNGTMSGLIQIAGVNGNGLDYKFKEIYKLYIPREFLTVGQNKLTLIASRSFYADEQEDNFNRWEWDYVKLEALREKAREPIHGRFVHLGTSSTPGGQYGARESFIFLKWLGIAYSGNWMRGGAMWNSVPDGEAKHYLETLKQLNMVPMPLPFDGGVTRGPEVIKGNIPASFREGFRNMLMNFGDLIGAIEVENEPGLFGGSLVGTKALAQMAKEEIATYAPHIKNIAPGWAYWPSNGIPNGWERDPSARRQVEQYSDLTNGHSYGNSGSGGLGGSIVETLRTYPEYQGDGFAKDMVLSEVGSAEGGADPIKYGTYGRRFAALFERELRADMGYGDHVMYHATYFPEGTYNMFTNVDYAKHNPENITAYAGRDSEENRVKVFRRIALAYATHGEPLVYTYGNADELKGKKLYTRAVNTATLGKQITGASSDKVLVNIVNFEQTSLNVKLRVVMPQGGSFVGDRFGNGNSYKDAHRRIAINTSQGDSITIEEMLAPGEAVQYILNRKETDPPSAATNLVATGKAFNQIDLKWNAASDNVRVAGYRIYRNGTNINIVPASITYFSDFTVSENTTYSYTVEAFDDSDNRTMSASVQASSFVMPVTPGNPKFEAEVCIPSGSQFPNVINDASASGGKATGNNYYTTFHTIYGFVPTQREYKLTIAYRSTEDSYRSFSTNRQLDIQQYKGSIFLPNSQGKWRTDTVNIDLVPGTKNIITVTTDWFQSQGLAFDYFRLDTGRVGVPQPQWRIVNHDNSRILYHDNTFVSNGASHESTKAGNYAALTFKGTGFRWYSNVFSNMGSARVYIDDVLDTTVYIPSAAFEGADKLVYEKTKLTDQMHTVRVEAVDERLVTVTKLAFLGLLGDPIPPNPDIVVTDITWTPAQPKGGQEILFTAKVKNIGTKPSPQGIITGIVFFVDNTNIGYGDTYVNSIAPGETVDLKINSNFSWTAPAGVTVKVNAYVNDLERYKEQDRVNNYFTQGRLMTIGKSNVAPVVSLVHPEANSLYKEGDVIRLNANAFDSDGKVVRVEFIANGKLIGEVTDTLLTFDWIGAIAGTYQLVAKANDDNGATTTSEPIQITVRKLIPPDLIVQRVAWTPQQIFGRDDVQFAATIVNQGEIATSSEQPLRIAFYIDGMLVNVHELQSSISPGDSLTVYADGGPTNKPTWTAPDATALYNLRVVADDTDVLEEADETNNDAREELSVVSFTDRFFSISARHSDKAITVQQVPNQKSVTHEALVPENDAQLWYLQKHVDGYYVIWAKSSGKVLEVTGEENGLDNGRPVEHFFFKNKENQKWVLERVSDAFFKLTALHSGKSLRVPGGGNSGGENIEQWNYEGNHYEQWYFVPAEGEATPPHDSRWFENNHLGQRELYASPNPATGRVIVHYVANQAGPVKVVISNTFSPNGVEQVFDAHQGENEFDISLSGFSPGLYTIKAISQDKIYISKLVVE